MSATFITHVDHLFSRNQHDQVRAMWQAGSGAEPVESAETVSQSNVVHVCVGAPNNKGNCHVFFPIGKKSWEEKQLCFCLGGGGGKKKKFKEVLFKTVLFVVKLIDVCLQHYPLKLAEKLPPGDRVCFNILKLLSFMIHQIKSFAICSMYGIIYLHFTEIYGKCW